MNRLLTNYGKNDVIYKDKKILNGILSPNYKTTINKNYNFKLDVSDEIKARYTSNLQEIADVNVICDNCKGLGYCPYDIIGLRKVAVANNNVINFILILK